MQETPRSCRGCGAPTSAARCAYCGTTAQAEPSSSGGAGALPCPRCEEAPLVPAQAGGARLFHCGRCAGTWVDRESLVKVLHGPAPAGPGGHPASSGATGPVRYVKCPRCGTHMSRRNWRRVSGVVVDECAAHGTWLDPGELQALRGFVADGGLERAGEAESSHREESERLARALRELRSEGERSAVRDIGLLSLLT